MLPERINGNAKKYWLLLDLGMQHVLCQCHLNIFTGPFRPPHKKNPGGATAEIVGREPRNSPPFSHISHSVKRNTEGEHTNVYDLPTSLDVNWHGFEGKVGAFHEDAWGAVR